MSLNVFPKRLDVYLVDEKLADSRATAKKLIVGGYVFVNGICSLKPSFLVDGNVTVKIENNEITKYVSRGALKLEAALDFFTIDVKGMIAADFGASTGGFTDLLLQRGAEHVYAIENGSGQLHSKLLNDERVTSFENTNARYIEKGFIPLCDIAVMDVSFISQIKLYKSVTNVLKDGGIFVSLIKPQFEAGKSSVGKNGIIKDPAVHRKVVDTVTEEAKLYGLQRLSIKESPILGGDGNKEFLAYFEYKEQC